MKDFSNKIAVITGAASGIGYAIAEIAATKGMRLVLADIEVRPLLEAEKRLHARGADVKAIVVDVTKVEDLEYLAQKTQQQFGFPHLLINNAGVAGPLGSVWQIPLAKLRWVLDVNLMGVVHGLQVFMPLLMQQQGPCHIVNTASMAGIYTAPYLSCYEMAKHGVVALTETLYHDLKMQGSPIGVSLLCPGWVNTNILNAERNCPLPQDDIDSSQYNEQDAKWMTQFARSVKRGISADAVAKMVFEGISKNHFYIFTHPEMKKNINNRMQAMLNETMPAELEF